MGNKQSLSHTNGSGTGIRLAGEVVGNCSSPKDWPPPTSSDNEDLVTVEVGARIWPIPHISASLLAIIRTL